MHNIAIILHSKNENRFQNSRPSRHGAFCFMYRKNYNSKPNSFMKKKNCKCEFSSERSEFLLKNFRESIARQSRISLQHAFMDAVDAPAPRFWVSEVRAMRVISMMMKSKDILEGMHSQKRKMYLEIYERVMEMKRLNPNTPLGDIVFEVVNSPAPSSYITWQYAKKICRS